MDAYQLYVISVLEMAVPLWAGAITAKNSQDIEAVQITCFKLIFGQEFQNYEYSLKRTGMKTLATRRDGLCLKFAKKCLKNKNFKHWFQTRQSLKTRSGKIFIEPEGKTKRYLTSSIPHLTRLLNSNLNQTALS